jgi:sugar phosphate isomerase/epimerase
MNLGFIGDNDLPGVERDAVFAKTHGFEGIEYNYWNDFKELNSETVVQMRRIHEKHCVRASMLGLWGWNHLSPDLSTRQTAHAMLQRTIDLAKQLGAEVVVTGAGDIPHEPIGRKVSEFVKVFPPFLDKIRDAGLKLALYAVHGASFLDSIEAYERVWEHIPDVTIKFDPANWDMHGDDYLEVARRYGNKIGYVHIKEILNHNGQQAISQPAAGMGSIHWGKLFAFLYEHNYSGWLSIEPHGPIWSRGTMREKMLLLTKRHIDQFLI